MDRLNLAQKHIARFWAKVDRSAGTDGCWLWTGGHDRGGYGRFSVGYQRIRAPRLAWELAHGPVPDGLWVLHNCPTGDNPSCVNPAHLWLGTNRENTADKVAKGRHSRGDQHGMHLHPERARRGEACPFAKLTDDAVRLIRAELALGTTGLALARRYGVDPKTITNIKHGRIWRHVA